MSGTLIPAGPSWAVVGARPSARSASPAVHSDFNGDGFADLAIGVPWEDYGFFDEGAVNVLYGTFAGLGAVLVPDQVWIQGVGGVDDQSEAGDRFGEAVAAGDFNADGFADLAVGAPYENVGGISGIGAVNVLYGSPLGLSTTFRADQLWTQDAPSVEGFAETDDHFGYSLAAGDFNGDGAADLGIGAPGEDFGVPNAGAVNVLYGVPGVGLQTFSVPDQVWLQGVGGVDESADADDAFGSVLTAGDFDGDGIDELAIGVHLEDVQAGSLVVPNAGAVEILAGSTSGLVAGSQDQFLNQQSLNLDDTAEIDDEFGYALAAGHFDGDEFADLAIAAWREGFSDGRVAAGAVHVLYGYPAGLQTSDPPDQFWTQNSSGVEDSTEGYERFGQALGAGDFNGDGFADLSIGVIESFATGGCVTPFCTDVGAVNVLYGSVGGVQTVNPLDQFWHQNSSGVDDTAEQFDNLGESLGAGDFNGDGFADLAMAVPEEDVGAIVRAGAVNVLYGSGARLQTASPPDQFWHQDSPSVEGFAERGDEFGWALSGGGRTHLGGLQP